MVLHHPGQVLPIKLVTAFPEAITGAMQCLPRLQRELKAAARLVAGLQGSAGCPCLRHHVHEGLYLPLGT